MSNQKLLEPGFPHGHGGEQTAGLSMQALPLNQVLRDFEVKMTVLDDRASQSADCIGGLPIADVDSPGNIPWFRKRASEMLCHLSCMTH